MEEPNRASFDSRWDSGAQSVANAGFLYFPGPLNWKSVLESNAGLLEAPTFWTEQTLVNLALRDAGATPLDAREFVLRAWWVVTFPGLMILIAVLAFNLMGDGLRDALDPKLKR